MSTIDIAVDLIQRVGFPIAVAIYLFYDKRTLLKNLQQSIESNTAATIALADLIKEQIKSD